MKKIYNYLMHIVVGQIMGCITFLNLMRKKCEPGTHYVILPKYIGDSLAAFAFLDEYKRKNGYAHIVIVTCPSMVQVSEFYKDTFDELLLITPKRMGQLSIFSQSYLGHWFCDVPYKDKITFAHWISHLSRSCVNANPFLNLRQYVCTMLYQIGTTAEIRYPDIPPIDLGGFVSKYTLKKGKTVLLNPYANTVKCDTANLFAQLAAKLEHSGYGVFTITANEKQVPVLNTAAIPCTLAEAFRIAEYCGTVIGLRSGFLDFLVFADCSIISIDDIHFQERFFFQIEKWKANARCKTIEYAQDDEITLQEIMDTLESKHF